MKQRLCGNCSHFFKINDPNWRDHFSRNGLCNKLDIGTNSDNRVARSCRQYQPIKYQRQKQ